MSFAVALWLSLYTGLELLLLAAFIKAALILLPHVLDYLIRRCHLAAHHPMETL